MSFIGIDSLPSELLYKIFEYVHYEPGESTTGNVCKCLFVCRKWQAQARLVLYKNVILNLDNFGRFLDAFDQDAVSHVTCGVSIRLKSAEEDSDTTWSKSIEGRVDLWLRRLTQDVLPHMRRLYRFTLARRRKPVALGIQKTTVAALLGALPMSCKALVLLVCVEGDGHLCGTLRELLPRMNSVLLALSPVCYSILGEYSGQGFYLNSLPKSLKKMYISLVLGGYPIQACPETHWQGSTSLLESLLRAARHTVHGSMEASVFLGPSSPWQRRLNHHVGTLAIGSAERPG